MSEPQKQKWVVRFYSEYLDEIEVVAETREQAQQFAEAFEYVIDMPKPGELEKFEGIARRVVHHEYVGSSDTIVCRVDPQTGETLEDDDDDAA